MTLRVLRKKLGLSSAQFARALGVNERTVARWNAGATPDGLAAEVIAAIHDTIDTGVAPIAVGQALTLGVRRLLARQLAL